MPFEWSPPSRAAWIEMLLRTVFLQILTSPPSRAAWIEIARVMCCFALRTSPPSRAAWIEIVKLCLTIISFIVAAFTGGVD